MMISRQSAVAVRKFLCSAKKGKKNKRQLKRDMPIPSTDYRPRLTHHRGPTSEGGRSLAVRLFPSLERARHVTSASADFRWARLSVPPESSAWRGDTQGARGTHTDTERKRAVPCSSGNLPLPARGLCNAYVVRVSQLFG